MADDKEKYDFGNTNAEELLTRWRNDDSYYEKIEKYIPASLDFFGGLIEKIRAQANIPDITFNYDDNIIHNLEFIISPEISKDCYDNWVNFYLTGRDGGIVYILVVSFEKVDVGCFGEYYIYPHRIDENRNVEIFDTTNKIWVKTNPEVMDLIHRESGDWAGEDLAEAFQNLADILRTCSTVNEADDILWKNKKLFALYRIVKPYVDIKIDNQWASEDIICLVPKDPFRKRLSIIQMKDTLVLGCIVNLEDGKPKFVEIYDIYREDLMAELIKKFCREGTYKREDGSGPEWGSGHILSYHDKTENGLWMFDDPFMNDRNSADIPDEFRNNEDTGAIPLNDHVKKLFTLCLFVGNAEGGYTVFEDSTGRVLGLTSISGRRTNLMVIELKDQLVFGCRFYSEEDNHNLKFITLYDTDSIDEMGEALKIVYLAGPSYSEGEYEFRFSDLSSGDIYPFEESSGGFKKREQGGHTEADQPTVNHPFSEVNLSDFDNIDPMSLETTEQKFKYLVNLGAIELETDEELELLNAHEFDETTELEINYMFESFIEDANIPGSFPTF